MFQKRSRVLPTLVLACLFLLVFLPYSAVAQTVTTVAGAGGFGTGPTQLAGPHGVAVEGDTLFIADYINSRIQKVPLYGSGAGIGVTVAVGINHPEGVAVEGDTLFIADTEFHRILKVARFVIFRPILYQRFSPKRYQKFSPKVYHLI